jgi:hypothetical protein
VLRLGKIEVLSARARYPALNARALLIIGNKYKTFHAIYWLKIIDLFRNTNDSLFETFLKLLLLLKSLGKILFLGINIKIDFNFSLKDIFN